MGIKKSGDENEGMKDFTQTTALKRAVYEDVGISLPSFSSLLPLSLSLSLFALVIAIYKISREAGKREARDHSQTGAARTKARSGGTQTASRGSNKRSRTFLRGRAAIGFDGRRE